MNPLDAPYSRRSVNTRRRAEGFERLRLGRAAIPHAHRVAVVQHAPYESRTHQPCAEETNRQVRLLSMNVDEYTECVNPLADVLHALNRLHDEPLVLDGDIEP